MPSDKLARGSKRHGCGDGGGGPPRKVQRLGAGGGGRARRRQCQRRDRDERARRARADRRDEARDHPGAHLRARHDRFGVSRRLFHAALRSPQRLCRRSAASACSPVCSARRPSFMRASRSSVSRPSAAAPTRPSSRSIASPRRTPQRPPIVHAPSRSRSEAGSRRPSSVRELVSVTQDMWVPYLFAATYVAQAAFAGIAFFVLLAVARAAAT